jgi:hypothetical protein
MGFRPRHGQWVKTTLDVIGSHKSADGLSVGVYQRAYTDAQGEPVPEHVAFCRTDGRNLTVHDEEADVLKTVAAHPDDLPDLQPCEVADCPPSRVAHLDPATDLS